MRKTRKSKKGMYMSEKQALRAIADFYKCDYQNVVLADFFTENFKKRKFTNRKGRYLSILAQKEPYWQIRIYHLSKNKIHRLIFQKNITAKQIYNKNVVFLGNFYRITMLEFIQCLEFIDEFGIEQIPHTKIQTRILQKSKRLKSE